MRRRVRGDVARSADGNFPYLPTHWTVVTSNSRVRRRPISRRARAAAAAVIGAIALLLITATAAQAHSTLLATTPSQSGSTASSPTEVVLTFNEMPRQRFTTIHVVGPDGARRDSGSAQVINDTVHQALGGTRPAGTYTVDWRVISSDGHPVSGQFTYNASTAGTALPAVVTPPSDEAKSSGAPVGLIVVIVVVVVVVGAGTAVFVRRRRRPLLAGPAGPARTRVSHVGDDDEDDS
jgi:copper resistance protein C